MTSRHNPLDITVNGRPQVLPDGSSVLDLIRELKLEGRRLAIERNGEIVPRSTFAETRLNPADRLEIVHAIGGG